MSEHPVKRRKKLIEVAIPLEAINAASAREKSIRHGHPSNLHLWWARRPLAAARAVIFCQMVDDPSAVHEEFPTKEAQENERLRLFALISELVTWENTTNEQVLNRARKEIKRSWRRACADNADHPEAAKLFNPEKLPGFHDPFAGGGALPLEAQRLGLESYASDLNPVAVLINKAMIEIPPKFAGQPPVNPDRRYELNVRQWKGAQGLAEDVRHYGKWIRDQTAKRISHLYPKVKITSEITAERPDLKAYEGRELTVISWLWARTVKSPNPAFSHLDVPLASTFMLSSKGGKEAYVEPAIEGDGYQFSVRHGKPQDLEAVKSGTKLSRGANFECLMSGVPIPGDYIKAEGLAGRMGARMMAIVAEGDRERVYLAPTSDHEATALNATPDWKPEGEIAKRMTGGNCTPYGLTTWGDLFTARQLVALTTFSDLVQEVREQAKTHALEAGWHDDGVPLHEGGTGANAYGDAICIYASFIFSKLIDINNSLAPWGHIQGCPLHLFSKQSLPMAWDFCEANPLSSSSGSWEIVSRGLDKGLEIASETACINQAGVSLQSDAATQTISVNKIVSTDPPYYDNIGYADLSDFFYVWMRRGLRNAFPDLFATLTTPKAPELVATPCRHGGREAAELFFLDGMKKAMSLLQKSSNQAFPLTIYYAFKQQEKKNGNSSSSTGWETFLGAVIEAGFAIVGTWPIATERKERAIGQGSNALASSIVLVCERRQASAGNISRSDFRRLLRVELPTAIKDLERANIAPVDVAQASIGPGMAIFSAAKSVLNPDDSVMSVRDALIEINIALDEYLSKDEGDLDADSRFALTFFESYGYNERDFGDAENLAKARNVSVAGIAEAGVLRSLAGKVKLLQRSELEDEWDPARDKRLCIWEATQQLICRLEADGEVAAASLLSQLKQISGHGDLAANCRALAYRLYNHCEKTKQAEEARAYNGLVIAWPELERLASNRSTETTVQASLI